MISPTRAPPTVVAGFNTLVAGDVTGDGLLDLVEVSSSAGLLLRAATAPAVFAAPVTICASCTGFSVSLADVDNDGDLDVMSTDANAGSTKLVVGDGRGGFGAPRTIAAPVQTAGDFDGDGCTDLVARGFASVSAILPGRGARQLGTPVPLQNVFDAFDAAVELLRGACGSRVSLACNDNAVGRNPRLVNVALAAGTHCIAVDGRAARSGNFQLSLRLGTAIP